MFTNDKNKECIKKLRIFVFLFFLLIIVSFAIPFLIFIVIWFFFFKRKNFKWYLERLWVLDCLKNRFWDDIFERIKNERWSWIYNSSKTTITKTIKNKDTWELETKTYTYTNKDDKNNSFKLDGDLLSNFDDMKKIIDEEGKKIIKKESEKKYNEEIVENKSSYNNWKSIWDNYESVTDKFKK